MLLWVPQCELGGRCAVDVSGAYLAMDFSEAFNAPKYSDISFVLGPHQRVVYAHRILLSSCQSEFFATIAETTAQNEAVTIENVNADHFSAILRYLYTQTLEVAPANLVDLLKLAVQYLLPGARDMLIAQLVRDGLTINNCISAHSEVCVFMNLRQRKGEQAHRFGKQQANVGGWDQLRQYRWPKS